MVPVGEELFRRVDLPGCRATARAYAAQFIAPNLSGECENNLEVIAASTTAE